MRVLLRNFDRYSDARVLDTESGVLDQDTDPVCGSFCVRNGRVASLYCTRGQIWVQIDKLRIPVDEQTRSELVRGAERSEITIMHGDDVVFTDRYARPSTLQKPDPTPFVEEEQWDFYLLVHNIISRRDRQEVLIAASREREP